eukprot:405995-Prorocentrum_minimum.AAC.2
MHPCPPPAACQLASFSKMARLRVSLVGVGGAPPYAPLVIVLCITGLPRLACSREFAPSMPGICSPEARVVRLVGTFAPQCIPTPPQRAALPLRPGHALAASPPTVFTALSTSPAMPVKPYRPAPQHLEDRVHPFPHSPFHSPALSSIVI